MTSSTCAEVRSSACPGGIATAATQYPRICSTLPTSAFSTSAMSTRLKLNCSVVSPSVMEIVRKKSSMEVADTAPRIESRRPSYRFAACRPPLRHSRKIVSAAIHSWICPTPGLPCALGAGGGEVFDCPQPSKLMMATRQMSRRIRTTNTTARTEKQLGGGGAA